MKKIAIIPNASKDGALDVLLLVAKKIHEKGAIALVDEKYFDACKDFSTSYNEFPVDAELIIVIGGDGSVIDASQLAVKHNIPILGVNLGHLGYLAEIEPDSLSVLDKIFTEEYKIEEKMLLSVTKCSGGEVCEISDRAAVNDVIISRDSDNYLGIADFMLITESKEAVKYRADGIIFSTPAGSTAYSLSAGGPVVDHGINSILVTPICPHSFFNRSIIFNENSLLIIKNTGSSTLKIGIDGRLFAVLNSGDKCEVKKSSKSLKVLAFNDNNMFSTLFSKMKLIENI